MKLTGKTSVAGIIGWPVEHSLSPVMHNAEYERLGLDWVYVPFAIAPEDLADGVRGLRAARVAGFNITIPHKETVLPFLDELSPEARLICAVNTVRRNDEGQLVGHNTDVSGWLADIQRDILLRGQSVCILGGGGAARALAAGAAMGEASRVYIHNRTPPRAAEIAKALAPHFSATEFDWNKEGAPEAEAREKFSSCEIIVNATPLGMPGSPGTPVPEAWLKSDQYVYDSIYVPAETALLAAAKRRGCSTRNGIGMLVRQGAAAFELWTGVAPDADRMESIIQRELAAK